jgi:predicted RNase H-like nuclease (RuvC/YqgF family)
MPEEPVEPKVEPKEPSDEPDYKAEAEKWKKLSRQNETAAKAAADELKALKEAGDASKSEMDKLTSRLASLETKSAEAEARALRAEVASEKQLPAILAKRLQGATREELEADAEELLQTLKLKGGGDSGDGAKSSGNGAPRTRPRERLSGGSDPSHEPDEMDPRKLAAKIPRR